MTEQAPAQLSGTPIIPRALKLAVVELMALAVIGTAAYWSHGPQGLIAALIAASVCWLGAIVALIVTGRGSEQVRAEPSRAITMVYVSIMLRGAIPLIAVVVLQGLNPSLAAAGLMIYIVAFYLVTLASETVASVVGLHSVSRVERQVLDY